MFAPTLLLAFQAIAAEPAGVARELRVPSPAGHEIAATLEGTVPGAARPTVVLIAGAGTLDRDGYTLRTAAGHNGAFRTLSSRLTALGFAVVRFDKVGTGRSTGDYRATATTASLAADVGALVGALRGEAGVDPDRIILLGHSEGGAIAGIVAAADPRIAGVALLAAPAWDGRRIMEYQIRFAALRQHRRLSYTSAELIEASIAGRTRDRLSSEAWYPHFLAYDPLPPFRRLAMPVLVLQGERDEVVLAVQADEIAAAIRSGGNEDVSLFILPDYGHALTARGDRRDPAPVSDEVLGLIERWMLRVGADLTRHAGDRIGPRHPAADPPLEPLEEADPLEERVPEADRDAVVRVEWAGVVPVVVRVGEDHAAALQRAHQARRRRHVRPLVDLVGEPDRDDEGERERPDDRRRG